MSKNFNIYDHFLKAVKLHKENKISSARIKYEEILKINPNYINALNNLGILYFGLKNYLKSEKIYKKVIKLDSQNIQAYNNLGLLYKQNGVYEKSIKCFKEAIKINKSYHNAYNNLGIIFFEIGKFSLAINNFKKAINIEPNIFSSHCNLGLCYEKISQIRNAIEIYKLVPKNDKNFVSAQYNLGLLYFKIKNYENTIKIFNSINYKKSKSFLLKSFYKINDKLNLSKELDNQIKNGTTNALIGSIINSSKIFYGIKKKNLFCENPLNYIRKVDLNENYDFKKIFIKTCKNILEDKKFLNKNQPLLVNGIQSAGNIFFNKNKEIKSIKNIIYKEIENYRQIFKYSEEGLIKNWPKNYLLEGWLVKMKKGGKIKPHIHEHGWLSGSIYINVPNKSKINDGNLIVSLSDKQNDDDDETKKNSEIINVKTGSFCLFPASLYHYTIPFNTNEDRIVLAFDVVPN